MYSTCCCGILMKIEFYGQFSKYPQISNFMKICQVGAELFHVGRQMDRHDEANSPFYQFYKRV